MTRFMVFYIFCQFFASFHAFFTDDNQARQHVDATGLGLNFEGNKSVPDHFKLLERDGDFLLIGARDIVYNLSMNNFDAHTPFIWRSTEEDVELCTMKGKTREDCHNYIRILAKQNDNDLLICGTNSYKPKCRQYKFHNGTFVVGSEFSGSGICPYDPGHNSTAFYVKDKNELYAGTVADFAGTDPLVSKRQIDEPDDLGLRTERSDTKCLNDPNFVSSFADQDHVYFWFREGAVEHMNCGKAVYSRVARVCKNDKGGPRANSDSWTTFLKAKLNCSIPGDYPFYFDEIDATSVLSQENGENNELVYGVFSTPYNSIRASAICAFSMETIRKIFSQSAYKAQNAPNANWLPILRSQVPQPRPGDCDSDSRLLSEEAVNFVKKNPLMDEAVPNYFSAPLLVQSGFKRGTRFTQIAVHSHVPVVSGERKVDVIFVGTDDGRVIKLVNAADGQQVKPVVVEIVQVFSDHSPIKNILVYRPAAGASHDPRMIVVGDDMIKSLPLHHCNQMTSCSKCVHLQDPYCAWDVASRKCVGYSNGHWPQGTFVQSLQDGDAKECSTDNTLEIITKSLAVDNFLADPVTIGVESEFGAVHSKSDSQSSDSQAPIRAQELNSFRTPVQYSATSMIIIPIVASLATFALGLFVGLMFPRCKNWLIENKKMKKIPSKNAVYPNGDIKSRGSSSPLNSDTRSLPTPIMEVSLNLDEDSSSRLPSPSKFSQTLPKEFKVKRTYL